MTKEYKEKLTVRVSRAQPTMALQQFIREVIAAGQQGFEVTETIEDHARIMGSAFSITLGREEEREIVFESGAKVTFVGDVCVEGTLNTLASEAQENGEYDETKVKESVEEGESERSKGFYQGQDGELSDTEKKDIYAGIHEDSGDDSADIDFNSMTKKKELLDYAKAHDISIPKEKKSVPAIRKYLKEL